ncbi:HNH endonuclease family protein [Bacteriovoracaceae bacterium]|nr:HNH endonuclease family protein [Bacteriovoracaceae bacterium]
MKKVSIYIILTLCLFSQNSFAKYKRSFFAGWTDEDRDCQNTRQEILIARSLVDVKFRKNRKSKKKKNCTVDTGKWNDYYYHEVLLKASQIDIDHVVPLKHAYDTGAKSWPRSKRKQFSNNLENLVITNKRYNRQKGAKTPLKWLPLNKAYACKYFKQWFSIKRKYQLRISNEESQQFTQMQCP